MQQSSLGELDELRRIENVVRLGHVEAIHPDASCSNVVRSRRAPITCMFIARPLDWPTTHRAIFGDREILLQPVTRASLSFSAGLIGFVEASGRTTAEKNRLCQPNAWPDTPFDWTRHLLVGMRTELGWQSAPDVSAWVDSSRLNLVKGLNEHPDKATAADLQGRFVTALLPALAQLRPMASAATPIERARMSKPVG